MHPTLLTLMWRLSQWASRETTKPGTTIEGALIQGARHSELPATQTPSTTLQLRTLLRRNPTWVFGHLELGEESLQLHDIATAYASAQASLILLQSKNVRATDERREASTITKELAHAFYILGRCYLRRNLISPAKENLELAMQHKDYEFGAKEELAAALMSSGGYDDALNLLSEIPSDKRSSEAAAAFSFLSTKAAR